MTPRLNRFHSRDDIREVEIDEGREAKLRQVFEETVPGERIGQCRAAAFDIEGEIGNSGVVVSSRLHHERIFDLVASYARGGGTDDESEIIASATVVDEESGHNLAAHVSQQQVLISRKHDAVDFEAFRDYILFLENSLGVDLKPVISSGGTNR